MKQPRWLASLSILLWVAGMLCIMRALEVSYDRIAAQLNTAGHLTRMGRQWIGSTIRRILDRYERSPPIYG